MQDLDRIKKLVALQHLYLRSKEINNLYQEEESKLEKLTRDSDVLKSNREDIEINIKEMDKKINEELGKKDEINKRITSLDDGKDKIKIARQLKSWEKEMERMQQEQSLIQAQIDYDMTKQLDMKNELERLIVRIAENEEKMSDLKKHIDTIKDEHREELDSIETENNEIKAAIGDTQFLDYFRSMLQKSKGNAIVLVEEDSCSGCNVVLPTYLQGELGPELNSESISMEQCPHCFRYLYYSEWLELETSVN